MKYGAIKLACLGLLVFAGGVATTQAAAAPANQKLTIENRLAIVREVSHEYVTLQKPLPASRKLKEAVEVDATGKVNEEGLRRLLANRGMALPTGEIVQITDLKIKKNHILFEINGGGKKKTKWYQRVTVSAGGPMGGTNVPVGGSRRQGSQLGRGSWVRLRFPRRVPDLTPDDVKQLMQGVFEFGRRSATLPWIETIPEEFREAIKQKKALVGMNREMVLVALGQPLSKVREEKNGQETEDWIYGNAPFLTFVIFVGDEVVEIKEFK
ncbi:MAG: hypothetical protein ACE1Z1_00120 [Candidatus Acidiferrales bacterium]|nr:hypothetical protein [Acidobacteriota bacterium]